MFGRLASNAATAIAALTTAAGALPAAYLALVTTVGLPGVSRTTRHRPPSTRFSILVPAHDEAAGIGVALEAFHQLDYPRQLFDVHVVADNCADDTAAVVRRHGWEVHERFTPDDPGKGPALNWLQDRLEAKGDPFDAIVVVDADTTLEPGFLTAMDAALGDGAQAAQGFYSVRNPGSSANESFRFAALACRHHLRALGRNRLGASCGLYGNGMVFTRDLMHGRRWSGQLVEDAEFQMDLLLDGHLVTYVPDAVLHAEMPTTTEQAASQNARWERGRIDAARRYLPMLARGLPRARRHRVAYADAIADHLVPPLSVVAGIQGAAVIASGTLAALGHRPSRRILPVAIGSCCVLVAHVLAGLRSVGAPASHYRSLVSAPKIIMWKIALWIKVLGGRQRVAWTRTARNTEGR